MSTAEPSPAPRSSFALAIVVLSGVALLALVGGLCYWLFPRPNSTQEQDPISPDPRLSYSGPLQNIHPDVGFVGDKVCVSCHREIGRTFAQHPMGRTLAPFAGPLPDQPLDRKHHHPFESLGLSLRVAKKGDTWLHSIARLDPEGEEIGRVEFPVHYAIGSASHGSSYLSVRDGFVLQTGVSWFSQKRIWDRSPGFDETQMTNGRPVMAACLYCHSNQFTPVADVTNRFEEPVFRGHAIGCERCHGPGAKHSVEPGTGFDPTIVNPSRLAWRLRENVCEQCHLQGVARNLRRGRELFDWRPGLPFEEFFSVHVEDNPDNRKANNHVEQMRASVCFTKSRDDGKLGCVSCHDPHVKPSPAEKLGHYRARCLNCHQERGCSVPVAERKQKSPADSCIECHMPAYGISDIVHASATDHTIPRRSTLAGKAGTAHVVFPARNFYADRLKPDDPETDRSLGLGIARRVGRTHPLAEAEGMRGLRVLEPYLRSFPRDSEAREALALLFQLLDRPSDAERHFARVLEQRPNREISRHSAARIAESFHRHSEALEHWRKLAEVSPYQPAYRQALARSAKMNGRSEESLEQTREWLRLDPSSLGARIALFHLLLEQGKSAEAGEVLAVLRRSKVANLAAMEQRYREAGGRR